jgi:predicted acetyltransferase
MELVQPGAEHLESYVDALRRGWSPDSARPEEALDQLAEIEADAARFLADMDDRAAQGPPVRLPDGTTAERLPGFRRWMWDGAFCGGISLRWAPGTAELPPHCLGHIGYSVVPWRRDRGYATAALRSILPEAAAVGLPYAELTTDLGNLASQRVILANGGRLVEAFTKPPAFGSTPGLRFRIDLARSAADPAATVGSRAG